MSSGLSTSNLSPTEASKKIRPQVDLWSCMTVKVTSIFFRILSRSFLSNMYPYRSIWKILAHIDFDLGWPIKVNSIYLECNQDYSSQIWAQSKYSVTWFDPKLTYDLACPPKSVQSTQHVRTFLSDLSPSWDPLTPTCAPALYPCYEA